MFAELLLQEYTNENERPLETYNKCNKKKVFWQCSKCSHKWDARIDHRVNGSGCPVCARIEMHFKRALKRPSILQTDPTVAEEWIDDKEIDLVSRGSNKKYWWQCLKCSEKYQATPNSRCCLGTGCPYCSGRNVTDRNRLSIVRPDLSEELIGVDPTILCCNSGSKQLWQCRDCKHQWFATVNNRFRGRDCPKCALKNSKPQKRIEEILKKVGLSYETEYKLPECKNKRPLPFDFAIFAPSNKLVSLIEYQGEQHFFPIWGQLRLYISQTNDKIKSQFCKVNGINLFEIDFRDDLEQKLNLHLKEINKKINI